MAERPTSFFNICTFKLSSALIGGRLLSDYNCSLLLQLHFGSACATHFRAGKVKARHVGVAGEVIVDALAEDAVALAVNHGETSEAGEGGGVQLAAEGVYGFLQPHAEEVDFQRGFRLRGKVGDDHGRLEGLCAGFTGVSSSSGKVMRSEPISTIHESFLS